MSSKSWADYVGERLGSQLSTATTLIRAQAVLCGVVAVGAVAGLLGWLPRMDVAFGWVALAVLLALAYSSPFGYLRRRRAQEVVRSRLAAAGLDFTGSPPATSVTRFHCWLEQNRLDPAVVREILCDAAQ
ncbi:hypothetical protein [Leifsonia sp. 2MCAF36]|uniref:hypothetical protein n=1 Tax=Leifsonia sp. 2MCAF36 TaxID=3232988 RepID=UPI003F9D8D71